jgi:hypothetical protein
MIDQNQILWDEKNLTELQSSCKNKNEQETSDITKDIKTSSTPNDWRNITDPKVRRKMRQKIYRETNKEKIRETQKIAYKKHYEANKEKIQAAHGDYNKLNKDKIKKQRQEYYQKNKRKILDYNESYHQNKLQFNTQYRLAYILRCRLRTALNKKYKAGHAVKDLGCSITELKIYLESKFQAGMSWENHSQTGWHIDHIKPLSRFDLSDREQFLEACHYSNLQPLWAEDNLSKSDNFP